MKLGWFSGKKQAETERKIKANDQAYNAQFLYANNYIKTSKYNLLTFLPKNLFEQFQRLANFYFLVLMILQLIPQISSLSALTTILPLCAVLAVTALKDGIDDIQRHRSDNKVNNRKSFVVRSGKCMEEKWQNVVVGDIIRMESDQFVAADLLLLSTSEPHGLCYIETAELDGETNLKARQALTETSALNENLQDIGKFDGEVLCEPPNNRLNSFEGKLSWQDQTYALDNEKMLLRGCVLRNTKWCFGLVIFAGKDTKLMQNSGKTTFKRTSLDRYLNVLILGIVVFLICMCLICTVLCGIWEKRTGQKFTAILPWDESITGDISSMDGKIALIAFLIFFSYLILLNTVVPISLYVSVEIIRFVHSWWINWDRKMYYDVTDTPARSRTTTLNEELGQIQYIFSDKTGTLTQNIMTFNKCSINGTMYGDFPEGISMQTVDFSSNPWFQAKFKWYDAALVDASKSRQPEVERFWRVLALCHTVMPEFKQDSLEYQAQSPDEAALTEAARNFGFVFKSRTPNSITIEVDGEEEVYELLCILDFNNVRKRMSVLLRRNGRLYLYCKGADTLVLERVAKSESALQETVQAHLDKFASDGLRTLVLAWKEVQQADFERWIKRHHAASTSLDNRQEKLDAVYEEIEQDMLLVGATAIEDKLQDGVPDTIAHLAEANIKIWVLTGDKQETAINIGYSCKLLTDEMQEVFVVDGSAFDDVKKQLIDIRDQMNSYVVDGVANDGIAQGGAQQRGGFQVMLSSNQHAGSSGNLATSLDNTQDFALVINGHSLIHALDPKLEMQLLDIGCSCKAVICCRVTPLQKALVVDLVKRNKKAVTLAVGDGANDVNMIKTAHIGVGISGQEGMQAVLASDFSIGQFRYLERLLLVHGRWSYYRMSKFLQYFFYKNFAFTLGHFWFAFFCAFSAQTIYDAALIACYNLCFTSLPVLALGIFDQDVNDANSVRYPRLYIPGQYNLFFNLRIFIYSVLRGIVSSLVIFFVTYGAMYEAVMPDGTILAGHQTYGFTMFTTLVVTVTLQIAVDTSYWTKFNHIVLWGSLIFYFLFVIIYYEVMSYLMTVYYGGVAFMCMKSATFWFVIIVTSIFLIVPVIALRFYWFDTRPTLSDRIRVKQNIRRLQSRTSEMQLRPVTATSRRSTRSLRSGYAFSHERGFGDLITTGQAIRPMPAPRQRPAQKPPNCVPGTDIDDM